MEKAENVKSIGVISDTHIPSRSRRIPEKALKIFSGTDMIIHCGDITDESTLSVLEEIAPVYAVRGNMDNSESNFPSEIILTINSKYILCAAHGNGSPLGLKDRLFTRFSEYKPYIILFGHTHIPEFTGHKGTLFFNPGSATAGYFKNTAGILTVNNDTITGEIMDL